MQIGLNITGLDAVKAQLGSMAKQANFAASRALNTTAFAVNASIKREMQQVFMGGPTPYTQRAFAIDKATKSNLVATVALRKDAPAGGTSYTKALGHLFTGGTRDWKKLEGYLRGAKLMPSGLMAVPGNACPLDARGNIRQAALTEMLGVLRANRSNLRVYRKTGAGKAQKAVGYFAIQPGTKARLHPGIYKRVETGTTSTLDPMVMFVHPGKWRKFIDLQQLATTVVAKTFNAEFNKELSAALGSAKP
jgi:hypothetical protein